MLRPTYPLATERLLLRPYTPDDLDAFHAIVERADVNRYLYSEPRDRGQAREVLARLSLKTGIDDEHDDLLLAVIAEASGRVIGHVTLELASREHRQGEIGYVIHPDHHGHGYATEAATLMLHLGFDELKLHRIVGRLDARNVASAHVLERLGMRREAHLRENELIKGEWCDELVYAMLASEWRNRGTAEGM
ncbi:MAG: GNAT family N-acetyltransferase [Candidatus Limnocylindria bacterium]